MFVSHTGFVIDRLGVLCAHPGGRCHSASAYVAGKPGLVQAGRAGLSNIQAFHWSMAMAGARCEQDRRARACGGGGDLATADAARQVECEGSIERLGMRLCGGGNCNCGDETTGGMSPESYHAICALVLPPGWRGWGTLAGERAGSSGLFARGPRTSVPALLPGEMASVSTRRRSTLSLAAMLGLG